MAEEKKKIEPSLDGDGDASAEGDAAPAEGSGGGKFNAKKIILFVVLPLFILGGAGGGLYMSGMLGKLLGGGGEAAGEEHAEAEGHGEEHAAEESVFLPMPDMLVNLAGEGKPSYLKLKVQLELKNEADKAAVEAVMPRVVDQFQTYLREIRVKDLRGSAGIYRLQMELLARVNAAAAPTEVKDVLFQEILIQ